MPTGILIPSCDAKPLVLQEFKSLDDYQTEVDGDIQNIELAGPPSSLFVNEEGKLRELPVNQRATLLLWLHNRPFLLRDEIRGDAILLGPTYWGETQDVPPSFVSLLLEPQTFVIESRATGNPIAWTTVPRRRGFKTWVDAYGYALMWTRLKNVIEVRVSVN
ncbi:DUF3846 domain-containing protein [Agreia sp. VKM Ac-1783]|uniref:DUF3846 domain-containing protein n=1 Tax=Agreia sp. VKM Ac-1783 TaxID=1938889 RepID=UPI000A2AA566|nr:DUF3846 domain-containing protein [Agreia sp. VKM Ac-1783]SMQ71898.1 protein of unknown function [Agreia sp. VKM Ac-1783]